uniref:SSD domain-containing protein n=1 Tax=Angiostrongylus cantonensis TaxID=6313 RepID=A0A158PCL7_ANGCA
MSIGFIFLLVFVIAVIWRQTTLRVTPFLGWWLHCRFLSTVLRSLVAITLITPFLATVAAFGLLSWMKYPIYSMQCVTPFLVLGIGVDDSFILIHRWKHRSDIPDHSLRLTKVIVDVGPSITITSLTNIIAFGIGFFTPTPQMSLFCLSTSVALFIDYIVTYTVLAPVVYLCSDVGGYQLALSTKPSKSDFLGKCHIIDSKAMNTGPTFHGIIARKSVEGLDYSATNKNKGVVCTRETLFEYLLNPRKYISATKMVFTGLKKADERADFIKCIEFKSAKPCILSTTLLTAWSSALWCVPDHDLFVIRSRSVLNEVDIRAGKSVSFGFASRQKPQAH